MLPTDSKARKDLPIATGVFDYFPDALAAVAAVSRVGNEKHNHGQPLHWAREKSNDHADCIARHLFERGALDTDGQRHSAKLAWRALALLQVELEAGGASLSRGSRVAVELDPFYNPATRRRAGDSPPEGSWLDWDGGSTPNYPPTDDIMVEVEFRNGEIDTGHAKNWVWEHICGNYDIVRYRVIPPLQATDPEQ